MFNLKTNHITSADGVVLQQAESIRLHAVGSEFGQKFYGEQKSYSFFVHQPFVMEDYFVLEYTAQGLRRQLLYRAPFVFGVAADGSEEPLVCYDDVVLDNRRHSVIVKTVSGQSYVGIKIMFYIDRRFHADFSIYDMYTCETAELPICCCQRESYESNQFTTVPLTEHFNSRYNTESVTKLLKPIKEFIAN